ncbi:hypothetical protein EMIT0194MI4_40526 [Pseudomonas sp. IT-194MI4]
MRQNSPKLKILFCERPDKPCKPETSAGHLLDFQSPPCAGFFVFAVAAAELPRKLDSCYGERSLASCYNECVACLM